mgnify:CR=1 FL=1|jgi:hypothetical protein|tara:strand:+ start:627 stop:1346 length:720 start_codon:yes stop_codon:yes gene_type:complete
MSSTITLNIPTSLSDIKLSQYQKYVKDVGGLFKKEELTREESEFANLKTLECFCDLTMKQAYKLPVSEFDFAVQHINELFKNDTPHRTHFDMIDPENNKVEFGFIPQLEDITMGEFVDLEKYVGDWDQMHKAMAVLYRPVIHKRKEFYLIEEYEGSDKYSEVMKDSPIEAAIGAMVFFYNLSKDLSTHLMDSLTQKLKEDSDLQQTLTLNGDGTNQYMHSLQEMSESLKKLQNYRFHNV